MIEKTESNWFYRLWLHLWLTLPCISQQYHCEQESNICKMMVIEQGDNSNCHNTPNYLGSDHLLHNQWSIEMGHLDVKNKNVKRNQENSIYIPYTYVISLKETEISSFTLFNCGIDFRVFKTCKPAFHEG